LCEKPEFDAYSAFRRVTTEHYGGITLFELKEFFQHHDIPVESYQLDLLYCHLDHDGDGLINWEEFLRFTMSKEYHSSNQYGRVADFNLELEHSLMRFFEQELQNEVALESRRRTLWDTPGLSEKNLFDLVDQEVAGDLNQENIHNFLKPYADDTYNEAKAERIWRRMDEDKNGRVTFNEFLRSVRPIYCYKNYTKAIPQQKDLSPTKIYHRPASRMGDGKSSRGNSVNSSSRVGSTKFVTRTEYDATTGRPLGRAIRSLVRDASSPRQDKAKATKKVEAHEVGLNPTHPVNNPDKTGHRWDRVMGWNQDVDPIMAMQMGLHPLDLATGRTDSLYSGAYWHHKGPGTAQQITKNPLNPENPDSPLKAKVSVPTQQQIMNTEGSHPEQKAALDHTFFTHQRLIERTLGNKEYMANPDMTEEERAEMVKVLKEKGLTSWQMGDPSMFGSLTHHGHMGGMHPMADPNMSTEEREKLMKNMGAMGHMHAMGPWGHMGNPNMTKEEREKLMKSGPYGGMGGPWGGMGHMGHMGPWGGMGGPHGHLGPWGNPNMTKEEKEKLMKSGAWGGMGHMGAMGPWGGMGHMGHMGAPWMNPNMTKEEKEKMMKSGAYGGMGGPWGGMGHMGAMGPWGGMGHMGHMGAWGNPNMTKEEREKMMKSGPYGGMGGPWGGMGHMGHMGHWGGMGHMGPNAHLGPWGNPNMTKEEREKLWKTGGWGGHMGAPWMNPNLPKEERDAMLKSTHMGPMAGPWASGIKKEQKDYWNLGKSNEKDHWNMGTEGNESKIQESQVVTEGQELACLNPEMQASVVPVEPEEVEVNVNTESDPVDEARMQQGMQGYIDVEIKRKLVFNLRGTIGDHRVLEEKRKNLAMRPDFALSELFTMVDTDSNGYANMNELCKWSEGGNINFTREDWAVMLDYFDKDGDTYLSFSEFSALFTPYTKEYKQTMTTRNGKGTTKFLDLTVQTKKLVRDLLYSIRLSFDNFEYNRHKVTGNSVAIANEVFDFLDRNKDGYVTMSEFVASLTDCGVKGTKQDYFNLFSMLDTNNDEKISFEEFHNPGKTADVEALNVL